MSVPCYTLRDVYNAARDERKFDYCFWLQITGIIIGEYVFMLLGRLLVIVASFLILSIGASGFLIALPVVAKPSTLWFNFNIFWGEHNKFLYPGSSQYCSITHLNAITSSFCRLFPSFQHLFQLHISCDYGPGETCD